MTETFLTTGDEVDLADIGICTEEFLCIGEKIYQTEMNTINYEHCTETNGNMGLKQTEGKQSVSPINNETRGEEFLEVLIEGARIPIDIEVPLNSRPPWLDEELLRKGREFGMKYLAGLLHSQMLSLAMLFSFRGGLESLIFTGKSGTPYTAFHRYLSTVTRIVSWYESDVFEKDSEAYNNMAVVRSMHASVYKRLNETSFDDLKSKITLEGKGTGIWSTYLDIIKKDLRSLRTEESGCPYVEMSLLRHKDGRKSGEAVYVNQFELSLIQFAFFGLSILYPQQFGIHGATEDELRGYVHLWRCLGYFLGIKDRFNICSSGDLEETRERCKVVIEKWAKPELCYVTPEWEHMFRCVVEGTSYYAPGYTFGASMAYLFRVLDIPSPNLLSKMTWKEKFLFHVHRLVFNYMLRIPSFLQFCNYWLHRSMRKARNASDEWLRRKRDKVYDFQKVAAPSEANS